MMNLELKNKIQKMIRMLRSYLRLVTKWSREVRPLRGVSCLGITLIETVVWITVLTLFVSAMVTAIIQVYRGNSYTFARASAVLSARKGVDASVKLLREAGYSESGAYPIVAMGEYSVTFYADYDNDSALEQVTLSIQNGALERGVIEPSGLPAEYTGTSVVSTVARNVQNESLGQALFTYYDAGGVEVTTMSNLLEPTYVEVTLITNTLQSSGASDIEVRGSAFMRNLKN